MDMGLLRSLIAVADAGAITEAASRLGLTQPALTRRIQQLESEFGAELLVRGRAGARLTELGRVVAQEARQLIGRYDALKREVAALQSVSGGTVRIGGGATAVSFLLPNAIAAFQQDYPDVHFRVKEASSAEIATDVAEGRLELGLVTLPVRTAELMVQPVIDDDIVLVAAPDNPLAQRRRVAVAELDGQSLVGFEADSAIRKIIDDELAAQGVALNVVMELRSIPTILRMVATTGSLAFVSRLSVAGQDLVRVVEVEGLSITREVALVQQLRGDVSPAAARFAERLIAD